ncbi:FAD-binding oxidoreductase, partial [Mesorhizobium wenxiniae]|uniref:FAD-binding oxidoreductase n=1 Tax=Mesorhizobium wenxiniae TaxID=2014805 RepID=UPI00197DB6C6
MADTIGNVAPNVKWLSRLPNYCSASKFNRTLLYGTSESRQIVIVGAGIHGLSAAWHLGENLRKSGKG